MGELPDPQGSAAARAKAQAEREDENSRGDRDRGGGAGGGMLRSTGEGLSPTTMSSAPLAGVPVLRPPGRVERMSGVLEADLVPRRDDRAGPG